MKEHSSTRRNLMKASFALPLLAQGMVPQSIASTYIPGVSFIVPEKVHHLLIDIYGEQANHITRTDKLQIKAPDTAENSAVVQVELLGEKDLVSSVAIFVAKNRKPLVETVKLSPYVDLPLQWRIRMEQTSDIIMVAQTRGGFFGVKKQVKSTLCCDSCV